MPARRVAGTARRARLRNFWHCYHLCKQMRALLHYAPRHLYRRTGTVQVNILFFFRLMGQQNCYLAQGGVPSGNILSPGQSASLNVTLVPAATGNLSGSVMIISDAANSSAGISLSAVGVQATVSSITVSPADPAIAVGEQVQFQAIDDFGNDITSSVLWTSSDPSVASITVCGLATGLAEGPIEITATSPVEDSPAGNTEE
jgi:hypothetical protein